MESVNSLQISAPPWWPLREGRDGKCEGRIEKCEFLARESVSSSPILARQWWRHFRLSLSVSLSLSLSLSHQKYLTHNIGLGRIWSFVFGFRSLVARLAPFERVRTKRAKIFLATESVNPLRISAPQLWPLTSLSEGRDGKCEGKNEKCEFLARESVNSSCEFLAKGTCKFIANFSATMVTSLPSLSVSLSLSLSPKVPHAQYRKRFRASYNKSDVYPDRHTEWTSCFLAAISESAHQTRIHVHHTENAFSKRCKRFALPR